MRSGLRSVLAVGVALLVWAAPRTRAASPTTRPASAPAADGRPVIRLWQGDAPGARGTADKDVPTLTLFLPDPAEANGAAVVVCPGGGYHALAPHEGKPVAQWLNTLGVTAFVLKYRLGPKYHDPVEMEDVNRAIRTARARASEWRIDPKRIGVLGFSAGGHLASTAVTHFDQGNPDADDPIDRASSRPDFGVLIYPVITLTGPFAHAGSRANLLGDAPSDEMVELMSNEKQVTDDTPPCFLVHTATDTVVPFQNSLMFAEAMQKHGVPVELHVFDHGAHGFGLGGKDPVLSEWPVLCAKWMASHGWLKPGRIEDSPK